VKPVTLQSDRGNIFVGNLDPLWVLAGIEFGADSQPGFGGGRRNEVDDHLVTDQRFAAPVLADEGKQPMLDLVPLAGSRWQMADRDLQSGIVSQFFSILVSRDGPGRRYSRQSRP